MSDERKVTLHFTAVDSHDPWTGAPYEWSASGVPFSRAVEWAERVRAGQQLDPFGRPWPKTTVRLEF